MLKQLLKSAVLSIAFALTFLSTPTLADWRAHYPSCMNPNVNVWSGYSRCVRGGYGYGGGCHYERRRAQHWCANYRHRYNRGWGYGRNYHSGYRYNRYYRNRYHHYY